MRDLKNHVATGMLALCFSGVALAGDGPDCRVQKLNGLYVFSATGYTGVASADQPKAIVELLRFNGDGNVSVPGATLSLNGVIRQVPPGGTGFYTLEADCRGTLMFNDGRGTTFDIYASPGGEDLWMIQTAGTPPSNVFQGNATRLSR